MHFGDYYHKGRGKSRPTKWSVVISWLNGLWTSTVDYKAVFPFIQVPRYEYPDKYLHNWGLGSEITHNH